MELRTNRICNTIRKWLFEEQNLGKDHSQDLHPVHPDCLFLVQHKLHMIEHPNDFTIWPDSLAS